MASKKILVILTDNLLQAVDAELPRRYKNRSELVRDLFRRWLDGIVRDEEMKADADHARLDEPDKPAMPYMGQ